MKGHIRIDRAIVLRSIGDLRIFTPYDLSACRDETQFGDVDFDDGSLGQDSQLGVERVLRVLLDAQDGQLHGDAELRADRLSVGLQRKKIRGKEGSILRDIGLLVTQTHRPDETLVLDRSPGEVATDKCGLGDHPLPRLLVRLLARVDDLEHLLLTDTLHLGQGHRELGRLLSTLILDSTGQSLGVGRLRTVEQVLGQRGLGRLVGGGGLDVLFLLCLDALAHLDLLGMTLLLVQLGPQAAQVLGILRLFVRFTGLALADALVVVEPLTVLLLPALNIPEVLLDCGMTTAGSGRADELVLRLYSEAVSTGSVIFTLENFACGIHGVANAQF